MDRYTLEARDTARPIVAALPALGGASPRGDRIAFTNASMTWNGRPWLAVAGEMHYARCARDTWRTEILKMKAGGVDIVSTYVFWIHHEEEEGVFDWSGDRDLRGFVTACAEAGVHAIVRVGPFCHGEVRNGGMPDWLYGRPFPLRSNDERYLAFVRRLYGEIGRQLRGLFFKDGGPIIGIQLENELMHAGAPWETIPRLAQEWVTAGSGGAEHLRALKRIALEAGLDAPLHTSTAWGGAPVLEGEVLPLYGGYAYCPWNVTESSPVHGPTREYIFRNFRRPARRDAQFDPPYDPAAYPFACCEMGGGMQSWYRYRFRADPRAAEAMAVMKLAGGCSMLGYYMYHGGSNPVGKHGFLNEHVVPRISYDFQAPLGEAGQVRESYRRLRRIHLFCRHFAEELAPTEPVLPPGAEDIDPRDTATLRFAARVRGNSGFLFLNTYQDHAPTADHADVQLRIDLPAGPVSFPESGGLSLKRDTCAILPFNLDLAGITLVSATVQPLARLSVAGVQHIFFFSIDGMAVEYTLRGLRGERADVTLRPRTDSAVTVHGTSGQAVVIHTLSDEMSLRFSILHLWGADRVVVTAEEVFEDGGALHVRSASGGKVDVLLFPAPERTLSARGAGMESRQEGLFTHCTLTLQDPWIALAVTRIGDADAEVRLPKGAFVGACDVLLSVEYDGDVGNALLDGRLVADDFSNGAPWEIGLARLRPTIEDAALSLHVTPRREGTVVIRESGMALQQELRGREVARLGAIKAVAVREAVIEA